MRHLATTGRLLTVLAFLAASPVVMAQGTQPSEVLDTGVVQFEFFDNGELGTDVGIGTGLVFNGAENALFEGTFLVGQSFSQVSGDAYEAPAYEWVNTSALTSITPPGDFDEAYQTSYNDSAAGGGGPLGVEVTAQAYAADGDPFVFNDFTVENTSGGALNDLYIGVFADWDVSSINYLQNLCDFNEEFQLLYCWDPTGDNPNYYGQMVIDLPGEDLTVTGVSYDALPGDAILYGGLTVIQTPPGSGADRRTVLGVGAFDLAAGESQRVVFAWAAGATLAELLENAQDAWDLFQVAIEPGPDGAPGTHALSQPAPNPSNGRSAFTLEVAQTQLVRVAVYDALGREVAVLHDGALSAGTQHRLALDASALPSGVYLVRVAGEQFTDTRTVTLTR